MAEIRTALITGITGQDGSYLAELLLEKGYRVHGIIRRSSSFNTARVDHLMERHQESGQFKLHFGDLSDGSGLQALLEETQPHELYNLGAQSHVRVSFDQPEFTVDVVGLGVIRLLEAVRRHNRHSDHPVRLYQAGSSEMFGSAPPPQNEQTPFHPRSPYACAKVYAHHQVINYRESYGIYACNGILFNHESPRRGETFVTRKITRAATRIKLGLQRQLSLGNLDARRDWGFAGDYVEAMWRMLQQDAPDDYVVATGRSVSVRDFLELVFASLGLDWREHVVFDPRFIRPAEVDHLEGDATKARERLGWQPTVGWEALARMMVAHDLKLAERDLLLRLAGREESPR